MFEALAFLIALIAGAVASVAGFGIGSLLTPFLSMSLTIKTVVAAVSIPHFAATLARFIMLRHKLNKTVLWHFGVLSAVGGLCGAMLHNAAGNPTLKLVFALLLIFAGLSGLTKLTAKVPLSKPWAWIAGLLSGMFGGLVGNQGGIRAAALLAFDLPQEQFVATATAIGLIVDLARMPVYLVSERSALLALWPLLTMLTGGCLVGTAIGGKALRRIAPDLFQLIVSGLILLLGVSFLLAKETI